MYLLDVVCLLFCQYYIYSWTLLFLTTIHINSLGTKIVVLKILSTLLPGLMISWTTLLPLLATVPLTSLEVALLNCNLLAQVKLLLSNGPSRWWPSIKALNPTTKPALYPIIFWFSPIATHGGITGPWIISCGEGRPAKQWGRNLTNIYIFQLKGTFRPRPKWPKFSQNNNS